MPAPESLTQDLTRFNGVERFLIGQEPDEAKSISRRRPEFQPAAPGVVGPIDVVLGKRLLVGPAVLIGAHWLTDEDVEHRHCEAFSLVVLIVIEPAQPGGFRCWEDRQQSIPEVGDQIEWRCPKDIVIEFVHKPIVAQHIAAVPLHNNGHRRTR